MINPPLVSVYAGLKPHPSQGDLLENEIRQIREL